MTQSLIFLVLNNVSFQLTKYVPISVVCRRFGVGGGERSVMRKGGIRVGAFGEALSQGWSPDLFSMTTFIKQISELEIL